MPPLHPGPPYIPDIPPFALHHHMVTPRGRGRGREREREREMERKREREREREK